MLGGVSLFFPPWFSGLLGWRWVAKTVLDLLIHLYLYLFLFILSDWVVRLLLGTPIWLCLVKRTIVF